MSVPSQERDGLLRNAMELRQNGQPREALQLLVQLQASAPGFSRLYQEQGHCCILLQDAPSAIAALQEAVRLNPTLPASWDMLEQIFRMLGETAQADFAAQNLAILKQLPPEVVMANSLYVDGDLAPAEEIIRDYLRTDGRNVGALRLLARICQDRGALEEAEGLLASVLQLAPDYAEARSDLAAVLLQQGKHLPAREQADALLRADPDSRNALKQWAAASVGLGDYEPVIDLYARLLSGASPVGTEAAELRLWRANALKTVGRTQEAVADYRAALSARADYGVAWFSLANLKTYRFSAEDIAQMQAACTRPDTQEMDRMYLCFALGKALEDQGDYAASWDFYARGNELKRKAGDYRAEASEECAERLKQVFTADFFAERSGWGCDDAAPIFVVGLPRSGSTLIEQIFASHSQVEGTQELTELGRYAAENCGTDLASGLPRDPAALAKLTQDDALALGQRYLAETARYRRDGRTFFIDKMPNNFWHIGLIQLILPRATIIDVRREPMACCFANLKQLYGTSNQPFAYGMEDIARYYRANLDVTRHWQSVLPGRVLTVHYEDVVDDLDGSVRRMLDHCGLPFEPTCLEFHKTERSVRTPSAEQVRQPISREGLSQWRHYEPWLAPLREILGDALTSYRN